MEVRITANGIGLEDLKSTAVRATSGAGDVAFKVERQDDRAIDPNVLVALIGAGSTLLGPLITGLLQMARDRNAEKIIVQTEKGRIEAPANLPAEQVEKLLARVAQLEAQRVNVHVA